MIYALLRYLRINTRIILSLLLCVIVSSATIILFLEKASRFLTEKYLFQYVAATQATTSRSIELVADQAATTLADLLNRIEICDLFEQHMPKNERKLRLQSIITEITKGKNIIGNIVIIDNHGEIYDNLIAEAELDYQATSFLESASQSIYPIWGAIVSGKSSESYLEFGQRFRNYRNGRTIGTLILYIKESAFCNAYHVSNWGESFILAENNYVISHTNKDVIGRYLYDSSTFQSSAKFSYKYANYNSLPSVFVIYQLSDLLNWKLVTIIPREKLFFVLKQINNTMFVLEFPIIVGVIILFSLLTLKITRPLSKLKQKIDTFQLKESLILANVVANDEIGALETSYHQLLARINELIAKNNQEKERQRELELIALQAQINPHFIYNTLDAIAWLAKLKEQHDIERLVMSLATFFRISLHRGDKYITVAEEIDLIRSFVSIEQVRFPGKFTVAYEIPPEILGCRMLKIIIQPIVENAIKHGIGRKAGPGEITIAAERDGDLLRFKVVDNGVGVDSPASAIGDLPHTIPRSGYGLRNVDERIKLEYGPQYGIEFQSEKGRGTTVTITVKVIGGCGEEIEPRIDGSL